VRTILLCRDGADQRHLANALAVAGRLDAIVVEGRGEARRGKLGRVLGRARWWQIPARLLDVAVLVAYGTWSERVLAAGLSVNGYPKGIHRIEVPDANDPQSVDALRSLDADVLIVLGTSILGDDVLGSPKRYALNLHGGALPDYRGVYSDFWALVNDRPDRVGSVVFHLDPGVDTGEVALEEMLDVGRSMTLGEIKVANARLRARLALQALDVVEAGDLRRDPQPVEGGRNWRAPTGWQLLRGLWHIRRSRGSRGRAHPTRVPGIRSAG
jgi:folate-dependent phosphoribosylglycinamide formyltransferase PurN